MSQEMKERSAVVAEAMTWVGTKYHHAARVKGGGVDCGMLLLEVYERAGLIPHVVPEEYPHDWHLHRDSERYLGHIMDHCHKIDGPPLPGDIVLFRYGRCISHGAIVIEWPTIIHSYVGQGVVLDDAVANADLAERLAGFWSIWGDR